MSRSIPLISRSIHQLAKQWKLGPLLYRYYYAPVRFLAQCADKGLLNCAIDARGRSQMEKAAFQLKPLHARSPTSIDVHFLTGAKFWYQTCFCAYSMAQQIEQSVRPIVYDDGSLTEPYQAAILRVFPNAIVQSQAEINNRINQFLPEHRFPYLRERRQTYPNLRKLVDVHVGSQGWKLVLDSDMLFFRSPDFLINWLQNPAKPCHMVDVETSYGYSIELMTLLTGHPIADRLNVGICGLNSEDIDWEKLEYWCKTLIEQQGTHYYQEQALIAMLMAGRSCAVAPADDYRVMPDQAEAIDPKAILHHYVAESKSWYFRYGWKHIQK